MQNFSDINYVALGDSITWGWALKQNEDNYASLVNRDLGFKSYQNLGICGSNLCRATRAHIISEYYVKANNEANLITVMAGINDFESHHVLDQKGDIINTTIYGALDTLAKGLVNNYPNALIIFITPVPMKLDGPNKQGYTMSTVREAIIYTANHYQLLVLDMYKYCPITEENMGEYFADYQHPNERLQRRFADYLESFLLMY